MLTRREINVCRAVLTALRAMPSADYLLSEDTLYIDAARCVIPGATTTELDTARRYLDAQRRIAGLAGESGMLWQITDAGRLWLAQNP